MARRVLAISMALAALVATGCKAGVEATGPGTPNAPIVKIPSKILGLDVLAENIKDQVTQVDRSYFDSVGLFSFREGDLLRATLQVSRFNGVARPDSASFRKTIAGLLGTSNAQEMKVGRNTVFSTSGTEQIVYAWFTKKGMFVLSVHRDFEFPRTLLRRSLAVEL